MSDLRYVDQGDIRLAYRHRAGEGPTVVFLSGYMSDMSGTKAEALDAWAAAAGRAFLRLDYSGCGASEGAFEDGTIGRWRDDARAVIDAVAPGPLVLVGSSMGGWIALLLAAAMPERVAALVGVAAAPDFVDWGLWADLSEAERETLMRDGRLEQPSDYGDQPYVYTRALVEDGRANRLLDGPVAYSGPVRLLQGQQDPDVPWRLALDIADKLNSSDVQVILLKDGDHRLSRPQDLSLLTATLDDLPETPCAA
ncbi:alpha/beta fold hydrolase [Sphingoaurantiacus capsulatus]|uniref:Palmitoyl-protein thioesterase ABHD10, mitochondrial n=1 Tax=Sphingoaurantiacus capsulatus TaxID=1771310 RepID=A0ABV7XAZ4_9SPHN